MEITKTHKVGILTSGGDAPGMNAAIRAVTRAGLNNGMDVFGIRRGFQGMIENDVFQMKSQDVSGILQNGGTFLQSTRSGEFKTQEGRKKGYDVLKSYGIDSLVVIGGDGSFTGANIFAQEYPDISVIGIPGTIDNDLYGTDYTIGYDTALNTVIDAVDKIRDTASSFNRIFFVEVMGREAGFIAINSGIASGAEVIMVPERKNQIEKVRKFLKERALKNKSSIIIVAEGLEEGNAMEIAKKIKDEYPEFSIRVSVLGHIQRGGRPTSKDRVTASLMGVAAIDAIIDNQKSIMIGWKNEEIVQVPLNKTIKMHKTISEDMLNIAELIGTFLPKE
ncbi:MAG: 6-phosphofructokinase [Prevotellaceae bacterium]|jgi:6-phosphofructokinase 1|nr:6-phosphofructokinase [Prevotellaceae bacterium]